jgi:hypothetical protein
MHSEDRSADRAVFAYLCSVLLLCGGMAWVAFKVVASPVVLVNAVDAYRPPARAGVLLTPTINDRELLEKETAELENRQQGILPLSPQAAMTSVQRPDPQNKVASKPAKKRVVRARVREQGKRDFAWGRPPQQEWPRGGGFFFW